MLGKDPSEIPRVLLVDDDPGVLAELSESLEAFGIGTLTANTATAAIELVQAHSELQVVITDLQMPRIDGIELLQKLGALRQKRSLAAIVITGYASLDRSVAALRLHAVDFLQKPLLPEEVAQAARRALSIVEDGQRKSEHRAAPVGRASYLKVLIAARTDRDAIFQSELFSDPAWGMLLDLAVAEATGRPISVTSLCIASGVPSTTALRRIADLSDAKLIERIPDPSDRRRIIVQLTSLGRQHMDSFVRLQVLISVEK